MVKGPNEYSGPVGKGTRPKIARSVLRWLVILLSNRCRAIQGEIELRVRQIAVVAGGGLPPNGGSQD